MIKITGNTYPAQNMLKQAGFSWDKKQKAYFGTKDNLTELNRISTATYSRANQKLKGSLTITEIN
jgi:hypothetical protein